eukprot:UN2389
MYSVIARPKARHLGRPHHKKAALQIPVQGPGFTRLFKLTREHYEFVGAQVPVPLNEIPLKTARRDKSLEKEMFE